MKLTTESIGENVRRHRSVLGWSREELAERSGVSPHTLYAIEQSKTASPRVDTLRAIATALGVSLLALVPESVVKSGDGKDAA